MTFIGALLFIIGRQLSSIFISDAAVICLAALSMKIWAFGMPMMGKSNTLAGGLRGGTWPMRETCCSSVTRSAAGRAPPCPGTSSRPSSEVEDFASFFLWDETLSFFA